jgi:hypothetical protein
MNNQRRARHQPSVLLHGLSSRRHGPLQLRGRRNGQLSALRHRRLLHKDSNNKTNHRHRRTSLRIRIRIRIRTNRLAGETAA